MKQFQENPWTCRYQVPIGAKVRGRVRNLTDFGAFVELKKVSMDSFTSPIFPGPRDKHPKMC